MRAVTIRGGGFGFPWLKTSVGSSWIVELLTLVL